MSRGPLALKVPDDLRAHRISPQDTVRLAVLAGPADGLDHTIVFEVWDPGGSQPPNSHGRSIETFLFLAGSGTAHSEGASTPVRAGQLLILPAGTTHHIEADADGLYAITTMVPDDGFAALIQRGPGAELTARDLEVLAKGAGTGCATDRIQRNAPFS